LRLFRQAAASFRLIEHHGDKHIRETDLNHNSKFSVSNLHKYCLKTNCKIIFDDPNDATKFPIYFGGF